MRFDVMPVATDKQVKEIEEAAYNVWHNYYKDIFPPEQIDYMLGKYQSKEALRRQMSEGYIYYMLLADDKLAGYMCLYQGRVSPSGACEESDRPYGCRFRNA